MHVYSDLSFLCFRTGTFIGFYKLAEDVEDEEVASLLQQTTSSWPLKNIKRAKKERKK
jgi:hypothetical protein